MSIISPEHLLVLSGFAFLQIDFIILDPGNPTALRNGFHTQKTSASLRSDQ